MTVAIVLYLSIYFGLFLTGRIGIYLHSKKEQQAFTGKKRISLRELTVIVPFRNEEHRILPLLNSLLNSRELPFQLLFVDDHSTDKTAEILVTQLNKTRFQLVQSEGEGKKSAILTGINHSKTAYILTLDADVSFPENYFTFLRHLKSADMHILPVKMSSTGWKKLFELDVYMVNSLNLIADGFSRPVAASGANLLFSKTAFEENNSFLSHLHIPSGDDQFLLADFNRANKEIYLHSNAQLAVTTPVPGSFSEFISQRLRWIKKTPSVPDRFAMKLGIVQLFVTLAFIALLICTMLQSSSFLFISLIAAKCFLDTLLVSPYFLRLEKQKLISLLPLYELIFPIYTVFLGILACFVKPVWKGRKTT